MTSRSLKRVSFRRCLVGLLNINVCNDLLTTFSEFLIICLPKYANELSTPGYFAVYSYYYTFKLRFTDQDERLTPEDGFNSIIVTIRKELS